ncbi:MAG TPA: MFS transporter [Mycobacteriales bacterium]|nr:MFS transporter [Mycobacteriales bacterium]
MQTTLIRHADFRRLWAADALSQGGTQITVIALPLLLIKVLDAGPFEVGLLTTCEFLAFLVIGLPAGVWVDRMRRRNVLMVADLVRGLLFGSLPLAWALDVLTLPQVYAVALLGGVCTVFFDVAYQSYLPHLVGRDNLVEGNAKLQGTQSVAQVAGPTVGGLLVQAVTAPYAILVDALSFLWSAAWITSIRSREAHPERAPDRHLGREMKEGLSFVLGHPLLRAITACTGTANLFTNVSMTVFVVLLADAGQLNLSAGTIGLLFSAAAVGGLVGALVARRFAELVGQGPALWMSIALQAPTMLAQPFVQRGWLLVLVAALSVVSGMTVVVYNVTQVSFRQLLCPERLLGRMNATIRFAVWGTIPIGALIGGILGSTIGLRPTLWVAVAGSALAVLPVFFSPLRTMRELPTEYVPAGAAVPGGPVEVVPAAVPAQGVPAAGVAGEPGNGAP